MPLTQINSNAIAAGVITADKLAAGVGGGPKITNIEVTNNSYTVLDDTAVDISGGYIKLTGTGFAAGCQVVINNTPATSTTFVSSTEVRAQVPAQSAGTYVVYLVNSDGGVAIRVNGVTYSATPTWTTGSTLTSGQVDQAISIQLAATGAATYALAAGSSLPAGLTLTSGGLLSGTVTGLATETTYSFTINAVDTENQDSPRTFSLTISVIVADPYFNRTTLLLQGNGTNNATNNTFLDSSTNNFTVTRNGNTTQGTFSPFSPTGWSNFIGTNASKISITSAGTYQANGNYTLEGWVMWNNMANDWNGFFGLGDGAWQAANTLTLLANKTTKLIRFATDNQYDDFYFTSLTNNGWTNGVWYHIAFVRSGGSYRMYLNGEQSTAAVSATDSFTTSTAYVGDTDQSDGINGYVSNLRFTESAVYTSSFTPAATSLSAISGTKLLTCQSNRFVDNSATGATFTITNDVSVQAFSPFAPAAAWSAGTNGGSGYFDGTGDYVTIADNDTAFNLGSGNFTIECWVYPMTAAQRNIFGQVDSSFNNSSLSTAVQMQSTRTLEWQIGVGSSYYTATSTSALPLNAWTHVAFVRNGNTGYFYFNGVQDATTFNLTGYTLNNSSSAFSVGRPGEYDGLYWPGYIADFRLVKGNAVYTSNFTPPTSPVTAIANTQLLLKFTNAGIYDVSAKNVIETVGDAKVNTSVKKYGTGSMAFDGTGDILFIPYNIFLTLGASNFTVEFWINFTSKSSYQTIVSLGYVGGHVLNGWAIQTDNGNGKCIFYRYNGSAFDTIVSDGGSTVNTGQWYHIAVVRNGSTTTMYRDGISVGSGTDTNNYTPGSTAKFYIGGGSTSSLSEYSFNGYIDDLRVTRGVARYTANFTPPTSEFGIQ